MPLVNLSRILHYPNSCNYVRAEKTKENHLNHSYCTCTNTLTASSSCVSNMWQFHKNWLPLYWKWFLAVWPGKAIIIFHFTTTTTNLVWNWFFVIAEMKTFSTRLSWWPFTIRPETPGRWKRIISTKKGHQPCCKSGYWFQLDTSHSDYFLVISFCKSVGLLIFTVHWLPFLLFWQKLCNFWNATVFCAALLPAVTLKAFNL